MSKLLRVGTATMVALSLFACGSDEEEEEPTPSSNGEVNTQVVQQVAGTAFSATETAIAGNGETAAFAMLSVGSSALAIVGPSQGAAPMGSAQQALSQGTCDCTENSCTFDDCGDAAGTGITITGTISWTENSLDCDYTVGGMAQGTTFNYAIMCDLDFTETSLDGTLSTSGDINTGGQAISFDTDLTFNMVTYASGQPTGGSIDVTASYSAAGQNYSASETVSF